MGNYNLPYEAMSRDLSIYIEDWSKTTHYNKSLVNGYLGLSAPIISKLLTSHDIGYITLTIIIS